jgi:CIC family chloride channel protein
MTGDYALTMAVMVAVVVSTVVTKQVFGHSYFSWQLAERGLDLRSGLEARLLRSISVRKVMSPDCESLDLDVHLPRIRMLLQASEAGKLFVLRRDGALFGTITLADLSELAFDPAADDLITASDVARLHPPVLAVTDSLHTALQVMRDSGEDHIAVVEDLRSLRFLGCLHERDAMAAYNRALIDSRREERE